MVHYMVHSIAALVELAGDAAGALHSIVHCMVHYTVHYIAACVEPAGDAAGACRMYQKLQPYVL